jgi:hypothetical protein
LRVKRDLLLHLIGWQGPYSAWLELGMSKLSVNPLFIH